MSNDSVCPTFRKVLLASVFGVCLFLIPGGVQSATNNSATLQWEANQEPDLAGYHAYHGTTSGNYGPSLNIGNTTTYQFNNLEFNKTHYFAVAAYDTAGNVSPPSPEVSKAITGSDSSLSISISGSGTVSSPGHGTCSRASCSSTWPQGFQLTLNAAPSSGSTFSSWGGACSGTSTSSCVVTLSTSSVSVSATFALIPPPSSPPPPSSLSVPQEEIKSPKQLAKAEKKARKQLAKAEKLLAKIQKVIAKIDQKLATHANNPKKVSRLNRKKVKLLAKRDKIQARYFIN